MAGGRVGKNVGGGLKKKDRVEKKKVGGLKKSGSQYESDMILVLSISVTRIQFKPNLNLHSI